MDIGAETPLDLAEGLYLLRRSQFLEALLSEQTPVKVRQGGQDDLVPEGRMVVIGILDLPFGLGGVHQEIVHPADTAIATLHKLHSYIRFGEDIPFPGDQPIGRKTLFAAMKQPDLGPLRQAPQGLPGPLRRVEEHRTRPPWIL